VTEAAYRDRLTQSRLTRRRAFAGAGALAASATALSLVGCGRGDQSARVPRDTSGLLSYPADTTKSAKAGGIHKTVMGFDLAQFDPHELSETLAQQTATSEILGVIAGRPRFNRCWRQSPGGQRRPAMADTVVIDLVAGDELRPAAAYGWMRPGRPAIPLSRGSAPDQAFLGRRLVHVNGRDAPSKDKLQKKAKLPNKLVVDVGRGTVLSMPLSCEIAPDIDLVEADERKFKQVMFNLLSHAIKFTPDGGRISVTASRSGDAVVVAVADTGIGIDEKDWPLIFEEFRQISDGSSRAHEGTGLGLALTKRLVELHGGSIRVESAVGAGSTFAFTLPVRQSVDTPATTEGTDENSDEVIE
jgi:hypothetical protein